MALGGQGRLYYLIFIVLRPPLRSYFLKVVENKISQQAQGRERRREAPREQYAPSDPRRALRRLQQRNPRAGGHESPQR